MNMIKAKLAGLKEKFLIDRFGFILLALCYLFLFITISTLPLFTYTSKSIITNLFSILSVISIAAYLFFRGKIYFNSFVLCYAVFLLYAIVTTLLGSKEIGYDHLISTITLYSLTFFIIEFAFNKKCLSFYIFSICCSTMLFSAFFAITYKESILSLTFSERFGSDYGNVNQIATIFIIGFLFLFSIAIMKKKFFLLLLIPAAICLFFTILTGSRWGLVSLVAGFIILFYFLFGRRYKIEFIVTIVAAVLLVIILLQLPVFSVYKKHFEGMFSFLFTPGKRGSPSMRASMIVDGFKLSLRNLLFGFGTEGFNANTSYGVYSHSTPIELLTNYGLIGFLLFSYPIYALLTDTLKFKRDKNFLMISGTAIFFIFYSLFTMFHLSKPGIICLGFFIGYNFYCNSHLHRFAVLSFNKDNKISFSFEFKNIQSDFVAENKKTKKIGFVISSLHRGGAERVASILANNWVKKGYDVTFFLTSKVSDEQYVLDKKIKVIKIVKNSFVKFIPSLKINSLINEIEKEKPDILVSFLTTSMFYASCASKELGIPLICSERNDPKMTVNPIYKIMRNISFKRASHIVFQGINAQKFYKKSIIEKSSIIINPCDIKRIDGVKKTKTIISAGRLTKQKGFDLLIQSFKDVKNVYPDMKLKIYGNGPLKDDLLRKIKDLHLEESVILHPFITAIYEEMASSTLFVSSSRYEGMPNVLCEAMLLGLPVVATNCPIGLAKDLVREHNNGEICNYDDAIELSKTINKVLNDISTYTKNANDLKQYYEEMFNPNTIADKWLKVFDEVNEIYNEN